jgi:hypothetical protein
MIVLKPQKEQKQLKIILTKETDFFKILNI